MPPIAKIMILAIAAVWSGPLAAQTVSGGPAPAYRPAMPYRQAESRPAESPRRARGVSFGALEPSARHETAPPTPAQTTGVAGVARAAEAVGAWGGRPLSSKQVVPVQYNADTVQGVPTHVNERVTPSWPPGTPQPETRLASQPALQSASVVSQQHMPLSPSQPMQQQVLRSMQSPATTALPAREGDDGYRPAGTPLPPLRTKSGAMPVDRRTGMSTWTTVVGGLGIVVGIFLLVAWAMRRAAPSGALSLPGEVFEVLGHAPMANRQQVHLLRCGSKLLLVSVTPAGTETLTEITDPLEVDRLAGLCQQSRPNSATAAFRQVFGQMAPSRDTTKPSGEGEQRPVTGRQNLAEGHQSPAEGRQNLAEGRQNLAEGRRGQRYV